MDKRGMIGFSLMVAGAVLVFFAVLQYAGHQAGMKEALAEANALVRPSDTDTLPIEPSAADEPVRMADVSYRAREPLVDRGDFRPQPNEVIGKLAIPKLETELPIIEGTDEEMLARGVGHYGGTAFPSDDEQIVLSGHRDTVFRNFDRLAVGDRFVVKLPYGEFEYEIRSTDIVDKDDTTVIRSMGTEVLVVTTCYPFRYIGDAPERFIVYAYPVDGENS